MFKKLRTIKKIKTCLTISILLVALVIHSYYGTVMAWSVESQPSEWALGEIEEAKALGLTTDKVLERFQNDITREEFAELAVKLYEKLSGESAIPVDVNPFIDTDNIEILKANHLGIIQGVGEGRFAPEDTITREQMATMFHRTLKVYDYNLARSHFIITFSDENKVSSWAYDATAYMAANGLLGGVGENKLDPRGSASREQAIALSLRTYKRFIGEEKPFVSINSVGTSKTIGINESEEDLLNRDVLHVEYGDTRIFVGYRQVTSKNQDPIVVRFDKGIRTWIRDDYERSGDDGKAYGIVWDGGDHLYIAFSATGTQGEVSNDYRRFTNQGWLRSYGRGGGARAAVIGKINPENGEPILGTFLYAKLENGNTNSMLVEKMAIQKDRLVINAKSWFSPLDTNQRRIEVTGSSPFLYRIYFDRSLKEALKAYLY